MEIQSQIERRWYQRGYDDGKHGWRAYNDTYIDVTGPLIVWRLDRPTRADAYAEGFSDALENHGRKFSPARYLWALLSVLSLALGLAALR